MSEADLDAPQDARQASFGRKALAPALVAIAAAGAWFPGEAARTVAYAAMSMIDVAPLVVPGILISAWVVASGAGGQIARALEGRLPATILAASVVGALTPVCGVTVLPLMAGLLAAGVPLAPVMAFWIASPVTDPAMFAATAATLGSGFAVGKLVAALGLGLLAGLATASSPRSWTRDPLRPSRLVADLGSRAACSPATFEVAVWSASEKRARFFREACAMTRLVAICLVPAFAAEHLLGGWLSPEALAAYVGTGAWFAVPLAVLVGAPAYLDGYAALPLTRGLIDHGMSQGAAMAFLVSGSVVSVWGAMAILPVLRIGVFALYLALAVAGSLCAGWLWSFAA